MFWGMRRTDLTDSQQTEDNRVASHLFTGGFVGIGKLPALFGWYIRYGIGIKWG